MNSITPLIATKWRTLDQANHAREQILALASTVPTIPVPAVPKPAAPAALSLAAIRERFINLKGRARVEFFRAHEGILNPGYVDPRAELKKKLADLPPGVDHEFFKQHFQHKSS